MYELVKCAPASNGNNDNNNNMHRTVTRTVVSILMRYSPFDEKVVGVVVFGWQINSVVLSSQSATSTTRPLQVWIPIAGSSAWCSWQSGAKAPS
jgi:hypothetical protein